MPAKRRRGVGRAGGAVRLTAAWTACARARSACSDVGAVEIGAGLTEFS